MPAEEVGKLKVFISYSRDDLSFVDQLDASLQIGGFETIIDRRDIPAADAWKERLRVLIRDSDTVVFVLSPSAARAPVIAWEVDEAVRLGKRIIPVLCRPLEEHQPPQQLSDRDYIYFYPEPKSPGSGFGSGLRRLASALNTDLNWLREHTRYERLAREWEEVGRPVDYRLLSARDIARAYAWAESRPRKAPGLTALQLDFIKASRNADDRQKSAETKLIEEKEAAQAQLSKALASTKAAQDARERALRRGQRALVAASILLACLVGVSILSYVGIIDRSYLNIQLRKNMDGFISLVLSPPSESNLKSGDSLKECWSCPEMIFVVPPVSNTDPPPILGSTDKTLYSFAIGKYEVTFDEWDGCVAHGACRTIPSADGWGRG
jgi:TIR domain